MFEHSLSGKGPSHEAWLLWYLLMCLLQASTLITALLQYVHTMNPSWEQRNGHILSTLTNLVGLPRERSVTGWSSLSDSPVSASLSLSLDLIMSVSAESLLPKAEFEPNIWMMYWIDLQLGWLSFSGHQMRPELATHGWSRWYAVQATSVAMYRRHTARPHLCCTHNFPDPYIW